MFMLLILYLLNDLKYPKFLLELVFDSDHNVIKHILLF